MSLTLESQQKAQVFIRWRPLTGLELEREDVEVSRTHHSAKDATFSVQVENANDPSLAMNSAFASNKKALAMLKRKRIQFNGQGFTGVFEQDDNNEIVFETSVRPLIERTVLQTGGVANVFAYGQTGSGKTHTMLGYGEEAGMFYLASDHLFQTIDQFNEQTRVDSASESHDSEQEDGELSILVRFVELYNNQLYNLLDDRRRCQLLEASDGLVHMRQTIHNKETGRTRSSYVSGVVCRTAEEVKNAIQSGLELRSIGISTTHDQSSRSHAIIEFEIMTPKMVRLQDTACDFDSEYTYFANEYGQFSKEARKAAKDLKKTKQEMKKHKAEMQECAPFAFGKLLFCDLAGSEAGKDIVKIGGEFFSTGQNQKQTKEHRDQAIQINKSLSALAGCLKALNENKTPIFRESRLTLLLRRYLIADNCGTVMLANLSPSVAFQNFSIQTLRYANLLVAAQKKKSKKRRRGKKVLRKNMTKNISEERTN